MHCLRTVTTQTSSPFRALFRTCWESSTSNPKSQGLVFAILKTGERKLIARALKRKESVKHTLSPQYFLAVRPVQWQWWMMCDST